MRRLTPLGVACGLTVWVGPAQAQLNGSHTLGDFGVNSGSQPQPGFYTALFYLHYGTAPMAWYVSKARVFGANYGAMVVLPFLNGSIEAPAFRLERSVDTGVGNMLIRPIDLGWHSKSADVAAGFQIYPPTGRYQQGGSDNLGKGMWTYEPVVGTTV